MVQIIPTELSKESVESFQKLYKQKYNEDLSFERAEAEGLRLLRLMVALIENIPLMAMDSQELP